MNRNRLRRLPILLGILALLGLGRLAVWGIGSSSLQWTLVDMHTPASIKVYRGDSPVVGTRAWYIDIDYTDKSLHAQPYLSPNGRERVGEMARRLGAVVAINGGFFDMEADPTLTYSLVLRDGKVLSPNIGVIHRANPDRAYPVTRSAFGFRADHTCETTWIAHLGDKIWAYPQPVPHTRTKVAPAPSRDYPSGGRLWDVPDAIGGGPVLISKGVLQDTYVPEAFFDSGMSSGTPSPRAAIGYTKSGHLILFATDGRQRLPDQGLTLPQLARELQWLGCVEAMNLDGGGSETLVVNGSVINQVEGKERAVTSVVGMLRYN